MSKYVTMERHVNVRRHSTWIAEVPDEILQDPTYFDGEGNATSAFDQWMCDNGDESNVEHDSTENDDLYFEVEAIE